MELIIAIMFFSLSAAVCVRLFTSAHFMAEGAENMSSATIWSQNLAEAFTGTNGDLTEMEKLYPGAYVSHTPDDPSMKSGYIILFFNEKWERIDSLSDAAYFASINISVKEASEVYSDVTDYNVPLIGKAAIGYIAVLDVRSIEGDYLPENVDPNLAILNFNVDTYLGKEAD
jgi:hypothetical protein